MKRSSTLLYFAGILILTPLVPQAQVAGSTVVGVEATEFRSLALGWSVKRQVLGKGVFNDRNEWVGAIDDVVVAPDMSVSYAIVSAGGFLGFGVHDVAIPVGLLNLVDGKLVLPGATKEAIKAIPKFEYAK